MRVKLGLLVLAITICGHSMASENSQEYPAPITVDTISDADKRRPTKVVEALTNTFIGVIANKKYSAEDIEHSNAMISTMTCMRYNQTRQVESHNDLVPSWLVTVHWLGPQGSQEEATLEIKASSRELASAYATCEIIKTKHVPMNRITDYQIDPVTLEQN